MRAERRRTTVCFSPGIFASLSNEVDTESLRNCVTARAGVINSGSSGHAEQRDTAKGRIARFSFFFLEKSEEHQNMRREIAEN